MRKALILYYRYIFVAGHVQKPIGGVLLAQENASANTPVVANDDFARHL
jgi:hypothetical protein